MLNSAEHETRPANKSQITNNYSNYTPPHNSRGVFRFHVRRPCVFLSVRPSARQSVIRPSVRFPFPDDKHRRIFTKLGMCIDIVEIWFGIANGHISSKFELSSRMEGYYSFKFLFPSC